MDIIYDNYICLIVILIVKLEIIYKYSFSY